MTVKEDLLQVVKSRDSDAAIMDFWSKAEYAYRVLCEALDGMGEAKGKVDLATCPASIKQNGASVLDKFQALRDTLEAEHAEFLSWEPPQE